MPEEPRILTEARLPDGRRVVLTADRWAHVVHRRGELNQPLPDIEDVLAVIRAPALREPCPLHPGRERLQAPVGPTPWLLVVTTLDAGFDRVHTVIPLDRPRRTPRGPR